MKRTHYLTRAIAGLFILSAIGFEMFVLSSAQQKASNACIYAEVTNVNCEEGDGTNCTYTVEIEVMNASNVTNPTGVAINSNLGNLTLNTNPPVSPNSSTTVKGTLTNVPCGPGSVTFTVSLPTTNCTFKLPINLPVCVSLIQCDALPSVTCVRDANGKPIYNITSNVTNNFGCPADLQIGSTSGVVQPNTFSNVSSSGSVSFLLLGATTNPELTFTWSGCGKSCMNKATLVLPPCVCDLKATVDHQTICKGGSTHVDVPTNTPGAVTWYYTTSCNTNSSAPNPPWKILSGGTTWYTLALDQTTCYEAVASNMPDCPNLVISKPVKVTVMDPGAGSITCTVPGGGPCPADVCAPAEVNLVYSNPTGSPGCDLQWEQWSGTEWQSISGATGPALATQTLTSSTCPFSIARFRVRSSCDPCQPTDAAISFKVYQPTMAGTLKAAKSKVCEGEDDVLTLANSCGDLQWEESTTSKTTGFKAVAGASGATIWRTNRLFQPTWYRVLVKNGPCASVKTTAVMITVKKKPTPIILPLGPAPFCAPGSRTLKAINPLGGTCQWYRDGLPIVGATGMSYSASASGNYYVVCTNSCGSGKSKIAKVQASKVVVTIEGASGVCRPACVKLTAAAGGGVAPYKYVWSPTNQTGSTINACPKVNTNYTVKATDANGCWAVASHSVRVCN